MKFIEMTGKQLRTIINDGEEHTLDFAAAQLTDDSIVRVNQHGDIEVRRPESWDVVGGLLGNYEQRARKCTALDWV